MFHIAQHDLPFGGIGASGMGHYHGFEGFQEFSKMRPVHNNPKLSGIQLFYPPYTKLHTRLFDLLLRFNAEMKRARAGVSFRHAASRRRRRRGSNRVPPDGVRRDRRSPRRSPRRDPDRRLARHGGARRARDRFPAFLYVYVDDADAAYRRALAAGAVALEEPFDTPYGDRRAMVRDPFGNVWQIAHVLAGS